MDKTPECFGQAWSDKATECAGGYDPGFVGQDGTKVRSRCDFFESCRGRTALTKLNTQTTAQLAPLIPPQALMRPISAAPYTHQPSYTPYSQPPTNVPGRPGFATPYQHVPAVSQAQITMSPVRMIPATYESQRYLTEQEERQEGESYWNPLLRTVIRSVGKSLGQAFSDFFDHNVLKR